MPERSIENHPRERYQDRGAWGFVKAHWRDFWMITTSLVTLFAAVRALEAGTDANRAVQEQKEGRTIASKANCAALNAVIGAGKETIASSYLIRPPRFEQNLLDLGLAPEPTRKTRAEVAAAAYARSIARAVEEATGSRRLADPDGKLNCLRLRVVSNAE